MRQHHMIIARIKVEEFVVSENKKNMEDFIINSEQKNRLKNVFKFIDSYDEKLILKGILEAAKEEYIEQFLTDGNRNTVSEIRQYKLFLLIKHVFNGKIPSENEVALIFKIPISSAKTIIKNMMSRYQFEMEQYFKSTIKEIFEQLKDEKNQEAPYSLKIRSSFIVSEINQIIEMYNPNCEKIKLLNDKSSIYKISKASRVIIEKYLEL